MFGSNVLDVAIGLVFLFLLLSLICSAANELIEMRLKYRAKDLERGITELVGGSSAKEFVARIYDHGLVNSLFRGQYLTTPKRKLPSYIPAENFALALLEIKNAWPVKPATLDAGASVADGGEATAWMPLPDNVETALAALEKRAAGDVNKLQESVENWYNSAMDRVSGWYKRRTQCIILFMGVAIAVLVNADCIQYAKRLSSDSSLRQGVVALAEATAKKDSKGEDKKPVDSIKENIASLNGIGLPIGWDQRPAWRVHVLKIAAADHWLGWLLTALAVSLGAPFWFDLLNKLMVIRSTVKPHEKSREQKPKDPSK